MDKLLVLISVWILTQIFIGITDANTDQYLINYNVPIGLSIISFSPLSDPTTLQGTAQTFNITLNKIAANVTWYMNGSQVQTNTNITSVSYTNPTANVGIWNISVIATDNMDTVSKAWNWTVNQSNLLLNPGFELSTVGIPDNWAKYPTGSAATFTYPEVGNDGSKAIGIAQTISGSYSWIQYNVPIVGDASYEISGYINTTNVVGTGAALGIDWYNSSRYISTVKPIRLTGTKSWTSSPLKSTVIAPSNATKANVYEGLFGTGKAIFDNVLLKRN